MFGVTLAALIIMIGPFTGALPEGSISVTARFSVTVSGRPGQAVHLRALGVPSGFIASFCTPKVCAPFQVSFALPSSGRESIELQLIENAPGARRPAVVRVAADGAPPVSIPVTRSP
jgi:hypothetical protein